LVKLLADCIGVSTSGFQLPLLSGSGSTDIYEEALEPLNDPIDDLLAGKVSRRMEMCMRTVICTAVQGPGMAVMHVP